MSLESATTPVDATVLHPHHALTSHSLLVGAEIVLVGALFIGGFRYLYRKLLS